MSRLVSVKITACSPDIRVNFGPTPSRKFAALHVGTLLAELGVPDTNGTANVLTNATTERDLSQNLIAASFTAHSSWSEPSASQPTMVPAPHFHRSHLAAPGCQRIYT